MGNLYLKYRQGFPKNLDKVFIQKSDETSITYQELENQSAAYANGFEALGLELRSSNNPSRKMSRSNLYLSSLLESQFNLSSSEYCLQRIRTVFY